MLLLISISVAPTNYLKDIPNWEHYAIGFLAGVLTFLVFVFRDKHKRRKFKKNLIQ
jgi:hypothetical protein